MKKPKAKKDKHHKKQKLKKRRRASSSDSSNEDTVRFLRHVWLSENLVWLPNAAICQQSRAILCLLHTKRITSLQCGAEAQLPEGEEAAACFGIEQQHRRQGTERPLLGACATLLCSVWSQAAVRQDEWAHFAFKLRVLVQRRSTNTTRPGNGGRLQPRAAAAKSGEKSLVWRRKQSTPRQHNTENASASSSN